MRVRIRLVGRDRRRRWVRLLGVVPLLFAGAAAPVFADDPGLPHVVYATTPDAVVVRYVEIIGELEEADPGPALTIFGDGRVVVHYPAYMRRAGDHAAVLARTEVDALVGSLAAKGVPEFDAAAVRQQMGAAEAARAAALVTVGDGGVPLMAVTDPSTTIIELSVLSYVARDGSAALGQGASRVVWSGLAADVARHPSVTALADLAAARTELRVLMDRVHAAATR